MLMINPVTNRIIFNESEYQENLNYLPLIVDALSKMDPKKEIHFLIDLPKTPVVFALYLSKVQAESNVKIKMYFAEDSQELRIGLEAENISWNSIEDWEVN